MHAYFDEMSLTFCVPIFQSLICIKVFAFDHSTSAWNTLDVDEDNFLSATEIILIKENFYRRY